MSFRKPAAFSLILVLLIVGGRVPDPSVRHAPLLTVDALRSASSLTARGGRDEQRVSTQSLRYSNPIYADPDDLFSKDPTVIEHEGKYYVYYFGFTTGGRQAIKVASSMDLVGWTYDGVALEARRDGEWDEDLIWAADVVFRNGLFYMYYTGGRQGLDGDIDWSSMRIGLATSREPTRGFERYAQNPILTPPFGDGVIDADFFADDDGKDYLYYVVQEWSNGHWEGIRVQRVDNMVKVHGDAPVIEPAAAWEANIVEAPTVFKADGYYYLLYSGGGSEYGQRIGYAFSRVPAPSGGWTKYPGKGAPQPLIDHGDKWSDLSVGSTSIVPGPNRHLYVVYQGKSSTDGKFRLGMTGLLVGGQPTPQRLAKH